MTNGCSEKCSGYESGIFMRGAFTPPLPPSPTPQASDLQASVYILSRIHWTHNHDPTCFSAPISQRTKLAKIICVILATWRTAYFANICFRLDMYALFEARIAPGGKFTKISVLYADPNPKSAGVK